jgi:hypothetical protein
MAEVRPQLLGQLWENGHIPALAALGFRDEDHLLLKKHLIGLDVHELRHPSAGLEQRLDEQSPRTLHAVGVGDELALLVSGESRHNSRARLGPCDGQSTPHFLGDIVCLIIGEVILPPEFLSRGDD